MEEYSYLSGGVPQEDGKRGHQCRVHEILLNVIVCSGYEQKRIPVSAVSAGWDPAAPRVMRTFSSSYLF